MYSTQYVYTVLNSLRDMLPSSVLQFAIGVLFESFSTQSFSLYCSLMFASAELDCESALNFGLNEVRFVRKILTLKAKDAGGGRLQALLLAYPRHEAILSHEVYLSRYDLDRSLYQSTPVALFRLDYTFERDRVGTVRVYMCWSLVCSQNIDYCTACDFTSRNDG